MDLGSLPLSRNKTWRLSQLSNLSAFFPDLENGDDDSYLKQLLRSWHEKILSKILTQWKPSQMISKHLNIIYSFFLIISYLENIEKYKEGNKSRLEYHRSEINTVNNLLYCFPVFTLYVVVFYALWLWGNCTVMVKPVGYGILVLASTLCVLSHLPLNTTI